MAEAAAAAQWYSTRPLNLRSRVQILAAAAQHEQKMRQEIIFTFFKFKFIM
jgi:hypothetical protein